MIPSAEQPGDGFVSKHDGTARAQAEWRGLLRGIALINRLTCRMIIIRLGIAYPYLSAT
jgi:hypothetical protein